MAWRCSGATNADLVGNLRAKGLLKSNSAIDAMLRVDRANYCLLGQGNSASYHDSPQPIGHSATISAPHMHAMSLELLINHLKPGARVLDVGSGSGYLTVAMAHMVNVLGKEENEPVGTVVGIDYLAALVQQSRENVARDAPEMLKSQNFILSVADGWKGYASLAPYDAIHVGAGADSTPIELVNQLKPGGRMLVPIGQYSFGQAFIQIDKDLNGNVSQTKLFDVSYVPLVRPSGHSLNNKEAGGA